MSQGSILKCDVVYRWINPRAHVKDDARRYRDNGELRFSMRSFSGVRGVRHLHIVAKGRPPRWLNISHPRIFWWNETQLLDQLRVRHGIEGPLNVSNSEPSKLAIAYLPNLADHFVLVDDDFFMVHGGTRLSTSLFFRKGAALQPNPIMNSHRPIPMVRQAYVQAVSNLSKAEVTEILRSGQKRIDLFSKWTARMWRDGTGIGYTGLKVSQLPYNSSRIQSRDLPMTLFWLWSMPHHSISATQAQRFFDQVKLRRPPFVCVNDNWPKTPTAYQYSVQPFRSFLLTEYPEMEEWELFPAKWIGGKVI